MYCYFRIYAGSHHPQHIQSLHSRYNYPKHKRKIRSSTSPPLPASSYAPHIYLPQVPHNNYLHSPFPKPTHCLSRKHSNFLKPLQALGKTETSHRRAIRKLRLVRGLSPTSMPLRRLINASACLRRHPKLWPPLISTSRFTSLQPCSLCLVKDEMSRNG
jgi:hypothetical protein